MRYKVLLLIIQVLSIRMILAQAEEKNYRLHFKSDEYTLDQNDCKLLDALVSKMTGAVYSELVIEAHTDQDAGKDYNLDLSNKRALSVKNYLLEKGITDNRISVYAFGEKKPAKSNQTAGGKAENRRVDIHLYAYPYANLTELAKWTGNNPVQTYQINPNEANTIKAKNGLTIKIPASVFVDEQGKKIKESKVTIEISEWYKPGDFTSEQLNTVADGQLLESGGMFSIKAFAGNNELRLKEGRTMAVELPANNLQNNMQVFVPVSDNTGITQWKATTQPFELKPKNAINLPVTHIDEKKLRSFKIDNLTNEYEKPEYLYKPLHFPKKPSMPKAPKAMISANKNNMFKWYERLFYPNSKIDKEVATENNRRKQNQDKLEERYTRNMNQYRVELEAFKKDSIDFETKELIAFNQWLSKQEKLLQEACKQYDQKKFNEAIDKYAELSRLDKLSNINTRGVFYACAKLNQSQMLEIDNYERALNEIEQLRKLSLIVALQKKGNNQGQISIMPVKMKYVNYRNLYRYNSFVQEKMNNDIAFASIFDEAQMDLMKKREKLGMLGKSEMGQIYSASLNQFGVYNCDRFSETPPNQMAEITIECENEARISFFIPEINSFIYANHEKKKGYYLTLPKGKEAKMIVLGFNKKGEPVYESRDIKISGNTSLVAKPVEHSIFDIKKALAAL